MYKYILFLSLFGLLAGCSSTQQISVETSSATVEEITEIETVLAKGKPVVVDFGAPWCGPCRNLEPEFKKCAEKHPEAIFVKVNTDKSKQLAADYKIEFIPQIIVMKGEKMIRLSENTEAKIVEAIKALD